MRKHMDFQAVQLYQVSVLDVKGMAGQYISLKKVPFISRWFTGQISSELGSTAKFDLYMFD